MIKILFLYLFFFIEANGLSLDFKKNFGSKGVLENDVNGPYGSYYDKHDNKIYITDTLSNKIIIYDNTGKYLNEFFIKKIPYYLHVKQAFLKTISAKTGIKGFYRFIKYRTNTPFGIITIKDKIVVTDEYNQRIIVYNKNGEFIKSIGTFGMGKYAFKKPLGIFRSPLSNFFFIIDSDNNRIVKYSNNFKYLDEYRFPLGSKENQLHYPYYGKIDNNENIYIVDRDNNRIVKFSNNFVFLESIDLKKYNDNLNYPHDITFDKENNLYIADTDNFRIIAINFRLNRLIYFENTMIKNPKTILSFNQYLLVGERDVENNTLSLFKIHK